MSRPLIVYLLDCFDDHGAASQARLLAGALPVWGFDVRVVALGRSGPLAAEFDALGAASVALGRRRRFDPIAFAQFAGLLRGRRPALIHSWSDDAHLYAVVTARAASIRWIAAVRRLDRWNEPPAAALRRALLRRADRIVVDGMALAEALAAHGLPRGKLVAIDNAAAAPPQPSSRSELLAELGLDEKARLLAVVGPLERRKRIEDAIWAADLLKVIRDDVHLLVIGRGPRQPFLERFRHLVRIADKVHFLGRRAELGRMLPNIDLLLAPGDELGQSVAVIEAMAAGVPVVAADAPGTRELIDDERSGCLVRRGDRAALARWANIVLDDAALRARFSASARNRWSERFRPEAILARWRDLYAECIEDRTE